MLTASLTCCENISDLVTLPDAQRQKEGGHKCLFVCVCAFVCSVHCLGSQQVGESSYRKIKMAASTRCRR